MKPPTKSTSSRLPSKGWGPFRYEWYSVCSGHSQNKDGHYYGYDIDCFRCRAGVWVNCWLHEVGVWVHDHHYGLWFWWTNRPKYTLKEALKEAPKHKNAR